jgi:Na+/melibiose symporter-like transporter
MSTRVPARTLAAYGVLGFPLAMAALPLYVYLPKFYGDLGMPLATLGALLLVLRLADGLLDPLIGTWSDAGRSRKWLIAWSMPVLAAGMAALFRPTGDLVVWLGVALAVVYAAFSVATINHGAWGAELSDDPVERTRITAARESFALAGVVVASVAPQLLGENGLSRFAAAFALVCLACTVIALAAAPAPRAVAVPARSSLAVPLRDRTFLALLGVFVANGIASSIPATLVLFFIDDVLKAKGHEGTLLAAYFVAGAAAMPLWVRLSARFGKVRAWRFAMVLSIVAFVWAATLREGDAVAFGIVCIASGIALGADLALPPSLLADVIDRGGGMRATGAYFGLWTLVTKLNLALAAGLALPLLGGLGYVSGTTDPDAIRALALVYAGLPCVLKIGAIVALSRFARGWQLP